MKITISCPLWPFVPRWAVRCLREVRVSGRPGLPLRSISSLGRVVDLRPRRALRLVGLNQWCRCCGWRYREGMSRLQRITSDPAVCHGQPTVRGLRYPVENLLELLSSGMTIDEVLDDYPDLERDDLLAALEFGALTAGGGRVVPLGAA